MNITQHKPLVLTVTLVFGLSIGPGDLLIARPDSFNQSMQIDNM